MKENNVNIITNLSDYKCLHMGVNRGTKRYVHVKSIDIIRFFQGRGFSVREILYNKRNMYATHLIRMVDTSVKINKLLPNYEIAIVNSYDAKHALKIYNGIFRFVCSNGLVTADDLLSTISFVHNSMFSFDKLNEYNDFLIDKKLETLKFFNGMCNIKMSSIEKSKLAKQCMINNVRKIYELGYTDLLRHHRTEDRGDDFFTVLNVIQENLIEGRFLSPSRRASKKITSPPYIDSINRNLYNLAIVFLDRYYGYKKHNEV